MCEERSTGKKIQQQVVRQLTVLDAPAMVCCGMVGYVLTPKGFRPAYTVWAAHVADSVKRRMRKTPFAPNNQFAKYETKAQQDSKVIADQIETIKKNCQQIRIIAHTQPEKLPMENKKAHIIEIQVNGGNTAEKVDFAYALFEKEFTDESVFKTEQQVDTISITHGHSFEGVITRWHVTRLPRKTRRGNRKVACIGPWHPSNIKYTEARAGQNGYFHRVDQNKIILKMGNAEDKACCRTEFDTTDKSVNPMGGWVNYGLIKSDFVMINGTCSGTKRRMVILRDAMVPRRNLNPLKIQWICTTAKNGHGLFETADEKARFFAKKAVAAKKE